MKIKPNFVSVQDYAALIESLIFTTNIVPDIWPLSRKTNKLVKIEIKDNNQNSNIYYTRLNQSGAICIINHMHKNQWNNA